MENKKIIEMIDNNQIEELRKILLQEICVKENKNSNTQKGLLDLSKLTAKEMEKDRPVLAGAYFHNGNTYICNGFYLVRIDNEERQGLEMAKTYADNYPQFDSFIDDFKYDKEVVVDRKEITTAKVNKEQYVRVGTHKYQTKYFDKILKCFDDTAKFYESDNFILMKDNEKEAILLRIREA